MELITITILSALFIFINSIQYIVGIINTPKQHIFLGTVHSAPDYFYYLSQFAQGSERFVTSFDLFTGEFKNATLVGWLNVFLGRVFHTLGISHIPAYTISVILLTILFFFLSYRLIYIFFPKKNDSTARIIAFFLAGINNAIPDVYYEDTKLSLSYKSFWYNTGEPFLRLGWVPHHIAATSALLGVMIAFYSCHTTKNAYKKGVMFMVLTGAGFILASLNPVQWALTGGTLAMSVLFFQTKKCVLSWKKTPSVSLCVKQTMSALLPLIFVFVSGLLIILPYQNLFRELPFKQLADWEYGHQLILPRLHFFLSYGPVCLTAIAGLYLYIKNIKTPLDLTILLIPIIGISIFFSPIPYAVKLHNIRFIPSVLTLFFAIITTRAMQHIRVGSKRISEQFHIIILVLVTLLVIPTYIKQIQAKKTPPPKNDLLFYMPDSALEVLQQARKISTPEETFLVAWPFNISFPGITGRRVFHGHELLTINHHTKDVEAYKFFSNQMTLQEMQDVLTTNDISYVLTYSWHEQCRTFPGLEEVYNNGHLVIYKVLY